jgi:hypothetical protein
VTDEAEPTELAGASQADTDIAHAWALDDGEDLPTPRWTPRRITVAGVTASLLVIALAGAVALVVLRDGHQREPKPPMTAAPPGVVTTTASTTAPPPPAPQPLTVTATPTISKSPFYGGWQHHGLTVTLAPDGSASYEAYLGVANAASWSATWSPMSPTTAMVVIAALQDSRGDTSGHWFARYRGEVLTFTLIPDGYATISHPDATQPLVVLCPRGVGFPDTKGLCGA